MIIDEKRLKRHEDSKKCVRGARILRNPPANSVQEYYRCECGLMVTNQPVEKANHLNSRTHSIAIDRYMRVLQAKIVMCECGIPYVDAYSRLHTTSTDHCMNLARMQKLGMNIPQSQVIAKVGEISGRKIVHVDRRSLEHEQRQRQEEERQPQ